MFAPRHSRSSGTSRRVLSLVALFGFATCAYAPRAVAQTAQPAQPPAHAQTAQPADPAQRPTLAQAAQTPQTLPQSAAQSGEASGMRAPGEKFRVRVSTRPPGGTVAVVDALTYRRHQAFTAKKNTNAEIPWRTLAQAREDLIGRYHFRVKWESGKNAEGEFSVMNAEDVILPSR